MKCRDFCGACCIAPSISAKIPGMENGKPAGVRCIHLTKDYKCGIFNSPDRPDVCAGFMPEPDFCGSTREEAMKILTDLEG
jgi:Fe-S-cluster containining protein